MKKALTISLGSILIFSLMGCSNGEKKEAQSNNTVVENEVSKSEPLEIGNDDDKVNNDKNYDSLIIKTTQDVIRTFESFDELVKDSNVIIEGDIKRLA
ncbi:hypothetical protein [Clostridium cellulovorans]|uniref:Lipoprotein n=1 Tax=Clostridium cellulovorans (strain ATCC 35296 / DSM 3052 / OCM 3 / 743B) TaxID=573061 RepID=D9SQZ5_CLOC7|nr:hypothetical protein [Clostridium cellulovorans]ADL50283.1 hypothetical protein Clocel_0508 [Clostridium cellulovorans 743B]